MTKFGSETAIMPIEKMTSTMGQGGLFWFLRYTGMANKALPKYYNILQAPIICFSVFQFRIVQSTRKTPPEGMRFTSCYGQIDEIMCIISFFLCPSSRSLGAQQCAVAGCLLIAH